MQHMHMYMLSFKAFSLSIITINTEAVILSYSSRNYWLCGLQHSSCMEPQLLPLLITASLSLCTSSATDQPVNFSLIVSIAPIINTSGVVSAVDQALELITTNTTILHDHCLQLSQVINVQVSISQCAHTCSSSALKTAEVKLDCVVSSFSVGAMDVHNNVLSAFVQNSAIVKQL